MNSAVSSAFLGADCVGRVIDGRFPLRQWLGGTEQSSVFLTHDGDPDRKVAIKLSPANALDAESRAGLWKTAKTLSHPHLMRIFHTGACKVDNVDLLYVVTEYADEVLSEILRERPLSPAETRDMLDPILDSLAFLHSRRLVHGQFKPSNIMVVEERLKLSTDRLHAFGEPGRASAWSGKYDAPEAALERMSPVQDVWSLGVVLVEALTQRLPLWDRMTGGDPLVLPSIPPPLFGIAQQCLRVDPARRATLIALREALQAAPPTEPADSIPVARPSQPSPVRALSSGAASLRSWSSLVWSSRVWSSLARSARTWRFPALSSRTWLIIAGGVLIVAVMIAAFLIGSHQAQPSSPPVAQSSAPGAAPAPAQTTPPPSAPPQALPRSSSVAKRAAATGSVVKGAVVSQSIPDIPQHIRDGITGHIRVRIGVQVDASGNVTDATADEPGPSRYFANKALQAARDWKFTPARSGGQTVASHWILEFHFSQDGTTATPSETAP